MGNHASCEGEITVAPWGFPDSGGKDWDFKPKHGIKQIIIIHGTVIDSIMFRGHTDDASAADCSRKFGGNGGSQTRKVDIDFPSEFLTGISGTYGRCGNHDVVISLKFYTNRTEYGPFGGNGQGSPFSFRSQGLITGFHGRAGSYIDAIGIYLKPVCSIFMVIAMQQQSEVSIRSSLGLLPRSPGPWGGMHSGREWDDGVFPAVKQVHVHVRSSTGVISAVRFAYRKRDGSDFWSPIHGTPCNEIVKKLEIDGTSEFLIGFEGFYAPVEGSGGLDVIRSLTFYTNKGHYGPMGAEIGTYFTSMSSLASNNGKVVGFHGRSGAFLDAIGIHAEY